MSYKYYIFCNALVPLSNVWLDDMVLKQHQGCLLLVFV